MDALELELKKLIETSLQLDPLPDTFDVQADLFETLGLDSVDALELAMAIRRKYGVEFNAEDDQNKSIFVNLKSLADFVRARA
ncbi:MAG: acyl carrier protein [Alphaproteobacteria bacterium]|nr:acyl carrier protein [Alphaproteobacteria bacterium]